MAKHSSVADAEKDTWKWWTHGTELSEKMFFTVVRLGFRFRFTEACIIPLALGNAIVPLLLERKEEKGRVPSHTVVLWGRSGPVTHVELKHPRQEL